MTSHDTIIPNARDFFAQLSENNTKAWWQDHKQDYDTRLKQPAVDLIDAISNELAHIYDEPFKGKLFRPHRDVRFSKDKTPYKTHLHMLWSLEGVDHGPGWFFGVSPEYIRIGWGWMGFTPGQISTWRDAVIYSPVPKVIDDLNITLSEPELKRIPNGLEKDHPQGDLLRRKSLAVWVNGTDHGVFDQIITFAKQVQPLHRELTPLLI